MISREEARHFLTGQHRLRRTYGQGLPAVRKLLRDLRCIQLDPLAPIGTNADLVALARIDDIGRGDVYRALLPGTAFEHFAKERCLIPAEALPWYRQRARETPWWRLTERLKRIPEGVVETVHEEIRERGPLTVDQLAHRGKAEALDWNGWKGTTNVARLAVEVLWTRCDIVVCGRTGNSKLYDVPERALSAHAAPATGDFEAWAIVERVEAAGLLARAGGPAWSMLSAARTGGIVDRLIEEGKIEEIAVEGSPRRYLAPKGFRRRRFPKYDGKVRILGPLDSFLWDRNLVRQAFGFDYVWEVYKPAKLRRWGWYVCPLLREDKLIGRIEAVIEEGRLVVRKAWKEAEGWDDALVDEALARHATACGVKPPSPRKRRRG